MIWLILYYGVTSIFLCYILLDISWRIWKRKLSFLPTTPNLPWIGSIPYWSPDPHDVYEISKQQQVKYGHIYVDWIMSVPAVRIGRVEYVEALLKCQETITKSFFYTVIREWLGEGLLISTKTKWKKRRIALTGAFHFSILNDFIDIYEKHAQDLVIRLQNLSRNEEYIEIQWLLNLAMLDVICETSMGVCIDALNTSESEYVRAVHNIKTLLVKRFTNPLLIVKQIYQYTTDGKAYFDCLRILHNFTIKIINEKIESRRTLSTTRNEEDNDDANSYRKKKKVLIDVLLDLYDNGEIGVEGIREEVDTFIFEGHDTTSSGLSWILYEIGRHAEVQKKIQYEIDEIAEKECSMKDKVRLLKYTECVIKEALRLHPPVPVYDRILEKDMHVDGNVIPSGTIMSVDCLSVHTNPAYWDEPLVFNPSRFEGDVKRNPFCYVPFSAGPRNCIGQKFAMLEEKAFLYYILSTFDIITKYPDEVKAGIDMVTYSVNGIHMKFSPRIS